VVSWERPREPFASLTNLTLFNPRLTRLEVAAAVLSMVIFVAATGWAYPGVAAVVALPTLVVVRVLTVVVVHAVQRFQRHSER
jgi:cell division protein FtsW (lipid II flippase)